MSPSSPTDKDTTVNPIEIKIRLSRMILSHLGGRPFGGRLTDCKRLGILRCKDRSLDDRYDAYGHSPLTNFEGTPHLHLGFVPENSRTSVLLQVASFLNGLSSLSILVRGRLGKMKQRCCCRLPSPQTCKFLTPLAFYHRVQIKPSMSSVSFRGGGLTLQSSMPSFSL
jgi:hypothetical protein